MYEVRRRDNEVIIYRGQDLVYQANNDSYIIRRDSNGGFRVNKVKDLKDDELLIALADSVELEKKWQT